MTPLQRSLLLLLPSLSGLVLILIHSLRHRGRAVTISFFVFGALYGVLRDAFIQDAMIDDRDLRMPYEFALPVLRLGDASIQAVIGWLFSIYTSWSIAEAIVRRFEPKNEEPRLFPVLAIACIANAAIGYAVEVAAAAANWWWWNISVKNPFTLDVPVAGVIAWFSVPFDFLLPFLLTFGDRNRVRWWGLLAAAAFPIHIKWTHGDLELGYQTLKVPFFTTFHLLMILTLLLGMVVAPLKTRGLRRQGGQWGPLLLAGTVIGITAFMQVTRGGPLLLISQIPIVGLVAAGFLPFPIPVVALVSAGCSILALLTGSDAAAVWALLPIAYLAILDRTFRSEAAAWKNAVAIVSLIVVGLAFAFCMHSNGLELQATKRFNQAQKLTSTVQAEKAMRQAIALCPHKDEFYMVLARSLQARGDLTGAEALYRELTERIPGAELAHVQLGNVLVQRAESAPPGERPPLLRDAKEHFEWAVKVRPKHPQPHLALGRFLMTTGKSDSKRETARSHLESALELASEEKDNETARKVAAESLRLLALLEQEAGHLEKAASYLDRLLEQQGPTPDPKVEAWRRRLERD
ncbi:MAG: tetratricopeptide repeat protein [Planctomycetota bacterium]